MAKKKRSRLPVGVKLLDDGRYKIRVTKRDRCTGRRRDIVKTLPEGTSLGQAVDALAILKDELTDKGKLDRPMKPPILRDYSVLWLERKARRVRGVTANGYAYVIANQILPRIGALKIDKIRRCDLVDLAADLESSGLAGNTVRQIWRITLQLLRDGWADHGLPDPSARVASPKVVCKPAGKALSMAELRKLLASAANFKKSYQALVSLLALTGLRSTEARLLLREDVDLDGGWLSVSHSKTENGKGRRVPLAGMLIPIIRDHLSGAPKSKWLFPGRTPDKPLCVSTLTRAVDVTSKKAGLELSPHDLRRTFVTLLHREGVDRLALRSIVGHSDDITTDGYVRLHDGDLRAALRVIDGGQKIECGASVWEAQEADLVAQGVEG